MLSRLIVAVLIAFLALCVSPAFAGEPLNSYKDGSIIKAGTTWSGRVEVDGVVFVPEGVTLTIEPGTSVLFKKSVSSYKEGAGGEGGTAEVLIPGSGMRVEGTVIAKGARDKAIAFTSAEARPAPGDWGCIFLDHSKGSVFEYCRFEYSVYTLHAHFSQFDVLRSVITRNEDGSRLGLSRARFDHCDITGNTGKGLNFRQCKIAVTWCNITGNQDGIFLNEKDSGCVIEYNNIYGNSMDLRLGEFHSEDVALKANWWGTAKLNDIKGHIYDKEDDPGLGRAEITPAGAAIAGAGINGPGVKVLWKFKTDGFVDSSPAVSGGNVYFGSWDKNFYALKADSGELVWKFATGDCVDSSPDVAGGMVVFGSWDRNIYCLDARTGKLVWKHQMAPSNFDDHRQSSPASWGKNLVVTGEFNGKLSALRLFDGMLWWESATGGAIRSRPFIESRGESAGRGRGSVEVTRVYAGSGDGLLYVYDVPSGIPLWHFKAGGAVNSSPAAAGGRVYFGSQDGDLYCLGEEEGTKIWSYQTGGRIEYSSPLLTGDLVIIGDCNGRLHAVDIKSGKPAWSFTGGGGIYSSPRLSGGKVVYGDNAGGVYCLDNKTGGLEAVFKADDAVQGLSTGPDGIIYAGSRDGYLYALSISE
jgi:outer membrane protein assembly factor BamB